MPPFFKGLLFSLLFITTDLIAQEVDSIKNPDDIVSVLKLKKKGILPFGFKPDTPIASVKAGMAGVEVFKEDSSFITYTVYFSNDKYDFGDITFEFIAGRLTSASIETYFGNKQPAAKTLNLLKLNFDKLYKPGEYSDEILRWKYAKKDVALWLQLTEIEFEGDNGFVLDFFTEQPDNQ